MVTNRKSQIISKPLSNISLAQAIEECEKEVDRIVTAESDPMLRGILRGRIHLSASDIAERIERKVIEAVVVTGDNGIIDPKQTTVTKAEAYKLMDFVRRRLADAKARFMAQKEYFSDPDNSLELQAKFYQLDEHAALAGLTALEAANLLLIREGELLERHGIPCTEVDAPPLAKKLLTLVEMHRHTSDAIHHTIHPLSEWLLRARRVGIEYIPGLDFAIAQYSSSGALEAIKPDMRMETSKMHTQVPADDKSLTPMKKNAVERHFSAYPRLKNALNLNELPWTDCRVPVEFAPGHSRGYYFMEKIERACIAKWGEQALGASKSSSEGGYGVVDGKKFKN